MLKKTPSSRFLDKFFNFDFKKLKLKKKKKTLCIKKKKNFYKKFQKSIYKNYFFHKYLIIKEFIFNKHPSKIFFKSTDIFNSNIILAGIDLILPGNIVFSEYFSVKLFKNLKLLGSIIFLNLLPYNIQISNIQNNSLTKWTFIKASGLFGLKNKTKKKIKLIVITLPSKKNYFFLNKVICYIGQNKNFFNHKLNEGKWGNSFHNTKHINVRGVAKNPVDHPNGGRGKTKQPEKSPWGWVAKNKK